MRSQQTVVMGHEFAGEVVEYGPGCRAEWPVGALVTALPLVRNAPDDLQMIGYSAATPGAYAQYLVVQEDLAVGVPAEAGAEVGALTEPLAVAVHAVRRGEVRRRDTAIVIGCGPVGLGVILVLKARGVRQVVAADHSPERRAMARRLGADVVVDPAELDVWSAYPQPRHEARTIVERYSRGLDSMAALRRNRRVPWWHAVRAADVSGLAMRGPVVFECVGVPGMIEQVMSRAPMLSRVVVVGVCMGDDSFRPVMGTNKELELRWVFSYDPPEFREALVLMTRGTIDARPLVTRTIGLGDVPTAFDELSSSPGDVKVMVDPWR